MVRLVFRVILVLVVGLPWVAACGTRTGQPRAPEAITCDVPTKGVELYPWLARGAYKAWPHEARTHENKGPHPAQVRTFLSPELDASLAAKRGEHPPCVAAVKEMFEADGTTRRGWAVSVKLRKLSADGAGWYWYETTSPDGKRVVADGDGVELCTDCHSTGGADLVLIGYPLAK